MLSNDLMIHRPLDKITTEMFQLSQKGTVMEAVVELVAAESAKTYLRLLGHGAVVSGVVTSSNQPASETTYLNCASIDFKTVN